MLTLFPVTSNKLNTTPFVELTPTDVTSIVPVPSITVVPRRHRMTDTQALAAWAYRSVGGQGTCLPTF